MSTNMPTRLAHLQLPSGAAGDLYTVPASTTAFVHIIALCNDNTTDEDIEINLYDGVDTLPVIKHTLTGGASVEFPFVGEGIVLSAANKITGVTTTASMVTCRIYGTEQTSPEDGFTLDDVRQLCMSTCSYVV